MLDKLQALEDRYEQLGNELLEVGNDYKRAAEISKERSALEALFEKSKEYRQAMKSLDEARSLLNTESDPELTALAKADIEDLTPKI